MKNRLLLLLLALCASCVPHRKSAHPPQSEPIAWNAYVPGNALTALPAPQPTPVATSPAAVRGQLVPLPPAPRRGFLGLFGRRQPDQAANGLPRKVKGNVTINLVQGDQHNQQLEKNAQLQGAGATNIDKAKGPTATSGSTATDQTDAGIASTIDGDGNAPTFTNTETPKLSPLQMLVNNLSSPLGTAISVLVAALVLAKAGPWLVGQGSKMVVAWKKRDKATDTDNEPKA